MTFDDGTTAHLACHEAAERLKMSPDLPDCLACAPLLRPCRNPHIPGPMAG